MQEWKVRQKAFHHMVTEHADDLNKVDIIIDEEIINNAIMHFYEKVDIWLYPAKSYAVAICYAKWISEDFNEDFFAALDDVDLLFNNDPYFKRYTTDPDVYHAILDIVLEDWDESRGMVPDIRKYYEEEMMFDQL